MTDHLAQIRKHYEEALGGSLTAMTFDKGPVHRLPEGFCVFEAPPNGTRQNWIYASCGMSSDDLDPIETFLVCDRKAPEVVELFYAIAYFHLHAERVDVGHTVNFGKPWLQDSLCDHAILSTMDDKIEWADVHGRRVHFLRMIPISQEERDYKIKFGAEALFKLFSQKRVDCANPQRESAINALNGAQTTE